MTEQEWATCCDPRPMLGYLGTRELCELASLRVSQSNRSRKVSDRKLRLFACAYARTASWLIEMSAWRSEKLLAQRRDEEPLDVAWARRTILDVRRRPARGDAPITFQGKPPWNTLGEEVVRFAEQFADGLIPTEQFAQQAATLSQSLFRDDTYAAYAGPSAFLEGEESRLLRATIAPTGFEAARAAIHSVRHTFVGLADSGELRRFSPELREAAREQTSFLQAQLLREIFGNMVVPIQFDPIWLVADDGIVVRLAESIYEEGDWDRLPILGDALEEVGCSITAVLDHCRSEWEHVRGCWLLDLLRERVQDESGLPS
jgi:hypothetical protein